MNPSFLVELREGQITMRWFKIHWRKILPRPACDMPTACLFSAKEHFRITMN
jgi:hypothetical protein